MPSTTTSSTTSRRSATRRTTPARAKSPDAVSLLRADHKLVSELFEQFEKSRSTAKKQQLVAQICLELTVHAQVEEEIFYPEVQAALKDKTLVPEARVEHQSIKNLIAAVDGVEPGGEDYDAKVKVMSEWVKHHVKEEQNEMFPKAKKAGLDMAELGGRILQRKQELMAQEQAKH
ncbi:hemerythrin domain-containing protein [Roseateles chitinivorans]|uniref:hemerythrin domain-containing protein n=1 Tax=Roseateles chitinivorans TaxID=2917965 RepID=UPI003D677D07